MVSKDLPNPADDANHGLHDDLNARRKAKTQVMDRTTRMSSRTLGQNKARGTARSCGCGGRQQSQEVLGRP